MRITLEKLIRQLQPISTGRLTRQSIEKIAFDCREVTPRTLFVAVNGLKKDGNMFVRQAIENGAAAVVSESRRDDTGVVNIQVKDSRLALAQLSRCFYDYPDEKLTVIGVTGTNGKSTTVHLIHAILNRTRRKAGLISTIEYDTGGTKKPAVRTTPESLHLQKYLNQMLANDCSYAVLEVTSHALVLKRTAGISFRRAVFTNFSHDHLDFHKNKDDYLSAKCTLFTQLSADGLAIVNCDDATSAQILAASHRALRYGLTSQNTDVSGALKKTDQEGVSGTIFFPDNKIDITSSLKGAHNFYNILAAAATSYSLGLTPGEIKTGIAVLKNVPGRMQVVETDGRFEIYIDFAHTPHGLKQALLTSRKLCAGKVILVFGCGGLRDKAKRPLMGRIAEAYADRCFLTSDNPRTESAAAILSEIDSGFKNKKNRQIIADRKTALLEAIRFAGPGDLILVAGRGHEKYQEIGGEQVPFDDALVCRKILKEMDRDAA